MKKIFFTILLCSVLAPELPAQVTGLSGWNIFLDPGHSRRENMGVYNYSEAEKSLRVALHLRDLLLTHTDIDTVYLSRSNDQVSVSLSQRTDMANSLGAAWYHSLHSNAGSSAANNTLMLWGQYYGGSEKVPNGGKAMSDIMIDRLSRSMRIPSIGSRGDCSFYSYTGACSPSWRGPYLHVNRKTTMPSELSEAGYHTSPVQNPRNMNDDWKRLEAWAFFWSILDLHGIERPAIGLVAGYVTDIETGTPINGAVVQLGDSSYTTDTFESLFSRYVSDPDLLSNGFFYFEDAPLDSLVLTVSAEGYRSDTVTVAVSDSFFTFHDFKLISTVPPQVVATTPAPGSENVDAWAPIVIDFSRGMNRDSVEAAIEFSPQASWRTAWDTRRKRLAIIPDTLEYRTAYTLTLQPSATDSYGNPLDGNGDGTGGDAFILNFTTGNEDRQPPQRIDQYPVTDADAVELNPVITFVFDEPIKTTSLRTTTIRLQRSSDDTYVSGVLRHHIVGEVSVLSFFPNDELEPSMRYRVTLNPGFTDRIGNAVTDLHEFEFSTSAYAFNPTTIDNFDSGNTNNWFEPQQSGSTTGIITEQTSVGVNNSFVNLHSNSTYAMRLSFAWDTTAGRWLLREYLYGSKPRSITFRNDAVLQVYVFGDGSGTKFRFAIDDKVPQNAAGNHEVSPWYTIDWYGWRLISWDLSSGETGDWLGDGSLDGLLRFDSIQLSYEPGRSAESGTLYFDDLRVSSKVLVSVAENPVTGLPQQHTLLPNYPNPFNPETSIEWVLSQPEQQVRLEIYDALGRHIRTLYDGALPAGAHRRIWDGRDQQGQVVASGTYIYKLSAGQTRPQRKMLLVR